MFNARFVEISVIMDRYILPPVLGPVTPITRPVYTVAADFGDPFIDKYQGLLAPETPL
jgi:hypothetical protein